MKIRITFLILILLIISNEYLAANLKNDGTIFVVGDKVNVRMKPNTKSRVVYQLRTAERIVIIKKSEISYMNKAINAKWVYVDTEYTPPGETDSIKGWVVDYYLADYSKFKKVKTFIDCSIKGVIGDWVMDYTFKKSGRYKQKKVDYKTGKISYEYGNIYQYRKVLVLRDDGASSLDFFYFDKKNRLCHYFRNRDGKSICTKCK